MDGWMDGWMDRWMNGWMNGWRGGYIHVDRINKWMCRYITHVDTLK